MAERILVVDDDEFMRESLQMELETCGYHVTVAANGLEALERARHEGFDLIVCDVRMPGMNGIDALTNLRQMQPSARSIVITGYASPDAPIAALKLKVDDYLTKPFDSAQFIKSVRTSLEEVRKSASGDLRIARIRDALLKIVCGVSFESRVPYLVGHSERVARLCKHVADVLKLAPARARNLYLAALLHETGRVDLPESIAERAELRHDEMELMRNQPLAVKDMLEPFPELKEVATIVLHHRERWDGSGYPRGLRGEQIPLESRILSIVETYDSLTSPRPHRSRRSPAEALRQLQKETGSSFDPGLVRTFVAAIDSREEEENTSPPPLYQELLHEDEAPAPRRASSLLGLGDAYRALGNLEVAAEAYREAEQLLDVHDDPDARLRLMRGRVGILAQQGRYPEALDLAAESMRYARKHSLEFQAASLSLLWASLALCCGVHETVAQSLGSARETFAVWEAGREGCLCDLLTAGGGLDAARKDPARLAEVKPVLERAFAALAEGAYRDLLAEHRALLIDLATFCLERDLCAESLGRVLGGGDEEALPILEGLLGAEALPVKLKALDLLAGRHDAASLSLLSRARLDSDPAVGQKSTLLVSHSRSDAAPAARRVAPALQVFMLGPLRVLTAAGPLDESVWPTRKIRSLFAYLVSRRGQVVNEERLMDLFWDQTGEKARHSLHNSVSQIRKILAPSLPDGARPLLKRRDGYVFNDALECWVDLEEFDRCYQRGRYLAFQAQWDEALSLLQKLERIHQGDFLQGFHEEWIEDARHRVRDQYLDGLRILAQYFSDKGKHEVSADYFRKMLGCDNCSEDAWEGLMLCQVRSDRQGEAIKIYHQCVQTLKKELDLAPPPRLIETYLKILHGHKLEGIH